MLESGWAAYERDGIEARNLSAGEVICALKSERTLLLATCAQNRVTVRPVSFISQGLTVYFQTGLYYLKTRQMQVNPNVAMHVGTYELEGAARLVGHPMDEANRFFMEAYTARHPESAARWSALPNQVLIEVRTERARTWRYVGGKPVIAAGAFENFLGTEIR